MDKNYRSLRLTPIYFLFPPHYIFLISVGRWGSKCKILNPEFGELRNLHYLCTLYDWQPSKKLLMIDNHLKSC